MKKDGKKRYKSCFFRECGNTSINAPTKIFVSVPKDEVRKQWIEIIRGQEYSQRSAYTVKIILM